MPIKNYTSTVSPEEPMEEWRPVPIAGYEEIYSVSSRGRIRREKPAGRYPAGYIMSTSIQNSGYELVCLRRPGRDRISKTVHRLVAIAFHGPPPSGRHEVHHNDNDKLNNWATNVGWKTKSENQKLCCEVAPNRRGEEHGQSKLTPDDVREIRRKYEDPDIMRKDIAAEFDIHPEYVRLIARKERWKWVE